jgi:hypothetical protein
MRRRGRPALRSDHRADAVALMLHRSIFRGTPLENIAVRGVASSFSAVRHRGSSGRSRAELTAEELRSAILLGILVFAVYPVLPLHPVDPWGSIAPRVA